jgi:SsrA-binding protein
MPDIATNRKARHDYHIQDTYEAGIVLLGTEIKAIRQNLVNVSDAYARFHRGELFLLNLDIQPYDRASFSNHEPRRERKLLLHKRELDKIHALTQERGLALPLLRLYWSKGKVKAEIGVGKGKQKVDKRHDLKKKVLDREAQRAMAGFNKSR